MGYLKIFVWSLFSENNLMVSRTLTVIDSLDIIAGIGFSFSHDFYQDELGMVEIKAVFGGYSVLGDQELMILGEIGGSKICMAGHDTTETNLNLGGSAGIYLRF